jgi:DNA-binding response OmpR family regulator
VPKRILVAEDEPAIARLIRINLERAGYDVTVVSDGIEAVVKIVAEQPDLVVLDTTLPRMDGYEIANYLRTDLDVRSIPVILLVPKTEIKRLSEISVDCFITKPFYSQELLSFTRRILKEENHSGETIE